jgi:hypothetical protein
VGKQEKEARALAALKTLPLAGKFMKHVTRRQAR